MCGGLCVCVWGGPLCIMHHNKNWMNIYLDAFKLNYCIFSICYGISHFILYHPICLLCIFIVFDSYVNLCLCGTIKYFVLYCIVKMHISMLFLPGRRNGNQHKVSGPWPISSWQSAQGIWTITHLDHDPFSYICERSIDKRYIVVSPSLWVTKHKWLNSGVV